MQTASVIPFAGKSPREFIADLFGARFADFVGRSPQLLSTAMQQQLCEKTAPLPPPSPAMVVATVKAGSGPVPAGGHPQDAKAQTVYLVWAVRYSKEYRDCASAMPDMLTLDDFSTDESLAGVLPFDSWGRIGRRISKGAKAYSMPLAAAEELLHAHRRAGVREEASLLAFETQLFGKRAMGHTTLPVFCWNQTRPNKASR